MRIVILALLLVCVGCANREEPPATSSFPGDEIAISRDCMPEILPGRTVEAQEYEPIIRFVHELSSRIFSCDYYEGEPVRFFGKTVKIKGRPVRSGYGLAIADHASIVHELFSVANFRIQYDELKFKLRIQQKWVHTTYGGVERSHLVYIVEARKQFIPWQTIGALTTLDFSVRQDKYTAFLWVQGLGLSDEEIVNRFRTLSAFLVPTEVAQP